jgi:nucleotide-binding universal stress UspA family protein
MSTLGPLPCPHRPLQTVLIGTSLEKESDQVVGAGLAVARAAGARVLLVHAMRIEPQLVNVQTGPAADFAAGQIAWRQDELGRQIERLGIDASELAGARVLTGAPHRVLVETARTAGASLLVVGATAAGPFAELLGSTADRVARKAACPVLLVRGELRVPPRRVLAPVDLSTLSGDAFRCGMDLLAQIAIGRKPEVRAIYALSFLDALALQRQKPGEAAAVEAAEHLYAEQLRAFVLENRREAPFPVETAVLPGEARFEILRELGEWPADLVVLGTHGRGGMDRLVLGSVAAAIARKAPCSVLLISPEAALAEGIADAVTAQTTPAWHRETAPAV